MNEIPSISKVQICGLNKHECGYCKDKSVGEKPGKSSISYGFVSQSISVDDYQSLMLAGWRRSGTYFYKPVMHKTCCPQYTIRLRVDGHAMSKSQKKVFKNVKKFLSTVESDDCSYTTEENLKLSSMFTFAPSNLPAEAVSTPTTPSTRGSMKLTVELEPPSVTAEKYELYRRYQIDVHHDKAEDLSEQGFKRFLVDSPLKDTVTTVGIAGRSFSASMFATASTGQKKASTHQYGSFHQLYRLNGVLIAVGVVDILPLGLSSVYLFYDNSYKQLSLGKYTALREIEYCKEHHFEYYFMGFYIHTCEKMKYKAEYKPSELLCPTTLQWYPITPHCSAILDKFNFSPFEPVLAARRALINEDVGTRKSVDITAGEGKPPQGDGEVMKSTDDAASEERRRSASDGDNTKEKSEATDSATISTIHNTNLDSSGTAADKVTASGNNDHSGTTEISEGDHAYDNNDHDDNGSEGEDEEEEEESTLEPSLLDQFVPMLFPSPTSTLPTTPNINETVNTATNTTAHQSQLALAMRTIPLDIGLGKQITLSDLREESIRHVEPFLQEWISYVGPVMGSRLVVSLV